MRHLAGARAALAGTVFPPSTAAMRWSWRAAGALLGLALGAALVQLLRLPLHAGVNTIWAEDGTIFLHGAKVDGAGAILHTYNGYLHLVPRFLAAIVAIFPLSWAALLLGVLSASVVGAVCAFVFVASRDLVPSPWWRTMLCAAIAFIPVAGTELLDNLANLQWYVIAAALWALLWRPSSRRAKALQFTVCLLAAGSDPLCALLLPLAIARVMASPSPRDHAPTLGLALGLLVQFVAGISGTLSAPGAGHAGAVLLGRLYSLRVLLTSMVGDRGARTLFGDVGWWPAYAAAVIAVVVAAMWALRNRRRGAGWLLAVFGLTSLLWFAVPVELRWDPLFVPRPGVGSSLEYASRYVMLPLFALWCLVAVALGGRRILGTTSRRAAAIPVLVTAAAVAIFTVDYSAADNARLLGPTWRSALAEARTACLAAPGTAIVPVRISPPGWHVDLPCADVVATGG